jgi:hypothetical protein
VVIGSPHNLNFLKVQVEAQGHPIALVTKAANHLSNPRTLSPCLSKIRLHLVEEIFCQSLVILTTLLHHHQQQQLTKHALQQAQLIYTNAFYASSSLSSTCGKFNKRCIRN